MEIKLNNNLSLTRHTLARLLVVVCTMMIAGILGHSAQLSYLLLLVGVGGVIAIIWQGNWLFFSVVPFALFLELSIPTGSEVKLNIVSLLVPFLLLWWLLRSLHQRQFNPPSTSLNRPIIAFLLASLLSLIIGQATWSTFVPQPHLFWVVQLAQWSLFSFCFLSIWLIPLYLQTRQELERWTWLTITCITLAACVTILQIPLPPRLLTEAETRAPFWAVLIALPLGQLLFNHTLSVKQKIVLTFICLLPIYYTFFQQREGLSGWGSVMAVIFILLWSRWPKLGWAMIPLLLLLYISGTLTNTVWNLAGGEEEWLGSGGSRLVLIERVLEVTRQNPLTGLGPAAYRHYARIRPLPYRNANWLEPMVSSHNNYVDLYSQGGLIGLGLFGLFIFTLLRLCLQLRIKYKSGFLAGYIHSALALVGGALLLMSFADWVLPFVYNIGFHGFQASILLWLVWGGLVAIETKQWT